MADTNGRDNNDESGSPSIFDLFEPPPEPDPSTFGKVPVVRSDDAEFDRKSGTTAAERKTAAEAEAAGLQHWTAPATGQVPKVLASENDGKDLWGDVKGPSWQSDDPTWSGPDLADVFAGSSDTDLRDDRVDEAPEPKVVPPPDATTASSAASPARRSELDDWGPDGRPSPAHDRYLRGSADPRNRGRFSNRHPALITPRSLTIVHRRLVPRCSTNRARTGRSMTCRSMNLRRFSTLESRHRPRSTSTSTPEPSPAVE